MTKEKLFELSVKLFECSELMKDLNMDMSKILLDIATTTADLLEKSNLPEDVKQDIESIKKELLDE